MENDTYTPPEPIMYNYKANFRTIDDCEGVDLDKPYDTIYICAYNVNTDGKDPFLRYLLTDQIGGDEKIEFPMVPILSTIQDMNTCVAHAYLCLVGLLMTNGYDKNMDQITFSGYYTFNGSIYLFYDITKKMDDDYNLLYTHANYHCIISFSKQRRFITLTNFCCSLLKRFRNKINVSFDSMVGIHICWRIVRIMVELRSKKR